MDEREKDKTVSPENSCPDCRGSGVVTYGCGAIPCAGCGGSGIAAGIGDPASGNGRDKGEDHSSSPDKRKAT